jgi:hypothetical protein
MWMMVGDPYVPSARAAREAGLREGVLSTPKSASWCSSKVILGCPSGLPLASKAEVPLGFGERRGSRRRFSVQQVRGVISGRVLRS